MLLIFMTISWMISITFMFLKHPLSLGFILLLQTIIISLSSSMMNFDYWYSYILFLIMIGGMLVLFIYMTSVASNEKFKFSSKLFIFNMISLLIISMFMFSDNFFYSMEMYNYDLINQSLSIPNHNLSTTKFFSFPSMSIMIILIFYLLVTLIAIVKITFSNSGPLRPSKNK